MEDTRQRILDRVRAHYNYLCEQGYEVMFTALQGSQNYGLDIYTNDYCSDVDTKSIVLPTLDDFIWNHAPVSTIRIMPDSEEHAEVKDIRIMFEMFRKANLSYIELLYSDYVIINPKYQEQIDRLLEMRNEIVNADKRRFMLAAMGMVFEKRKALTHPYPSVEERIAEYGYDGKQLSHAMRVVNFMERYSAGEDVKSCFQVPEILKQILIDIKTHKIVYAVDEAIEFADNCCVRAKVMAESVAKTESEPRVWEFLNELQARTMKQYILECANAQKEE